MKRFLLTIKRWILSTTSGEMIYGWVKSFFGERDPIRERVFIIAALVIVLAGVGWGLNFGGILLLLAGTAFIQNMAFTAVSRSRNAGDPEYHRWCAWASNGVWIICQLLIWAHLWAAFSTESFWRLVPLIMIYVMFTTEGSVFMMRELLKKEKGKRQVGAQAQEEMKLEIQVLIKDVEDLRDFVEKKVIQEYKKFS